MIEILHDFIHQNPEDYVGIVYVGSCRISSINSTTHTGWHPRECPTKRQIALTQTNAPLSSALCELRFFGDMSYSQYHGLWRHVKGGHRVLYGDCITALPESLYKIHVLWTYRGVLTVPHTRYVFSIDWGSFFRVSLYMGDADI